MYEETNQTFEQDAAKEQPIQDKNANKKPEKEDSFAREFFSWIKVIVIAALLAHIITNYVLINANVPTGSMENTIPSETRMFGFRLAYQFSEPKRGDIVIFKYPDDERENYVKRVIGLPNETVDIIDGKVYINNSDTPLEEDYLKETWISMNGSDAPMHFEVPDNSYFMLGDNRNDSKDSRYWANPFVKEDKILAKAIFSYWPLSHANIFNTPDYAQ